MNHQYVLHDDTATMLYDSAVEMSIQLRREGKDDIADDVLGAARTLAAQTSHLHD